MHNNECGPLQLGLTRTIKQSLTNVLEPTHAQLSYISAKLNHNLGNDHHPKVYLRNIPELNCSQQAPTHFLEVSPNLIITVRLFGPHKGRSTRAHTQI